MIQQLIRACIHEMRYQKNLKNIRSDYLKRIENGEDENDANYFCRIELGVKAAMWKTSYEEMFDAYWTLKFPPRQ